MRNDCFSSAERAGRQSCGAGALALPGSSGFGGGVCEGLSPEESGHQVTEEEGASLVVPWGHSPLTRSPAGGRQGACGVG